LDAANKPERTNDGGTVSALTPKAGIRVNSAFYKQKGRPFGGQRDRSSMIRSLDPKSSTNCSIIARSSANLGKRKKWPPNLGGDHRNKPL